MHELVENLSLESARREAILASMVEGVLAVDNELRVTFCNESFARAVGARRTVPERLPVLELVRDPGFLDMLSRVLVTHESVKQRMQLAAADGRAFEVQAAPLSMGSRRGAIAILHDITDLERLERIRKDFVANVSHELRTPLTAIRGYAETLLDGALEDEENNRKFLEVIRAHAIRLNNISSDLLVLSELESGKPPAEPEPVPIRAALESAIRTVESEARVRGVKPAGGRSRRSQGHGPPDSARAGFRQPARQRRQVQPSRRRSPDRNLSRRGRKRHRSRSPIRELAFLRKICRGFSSAFIAWTRRARAKLAERAWAFRSSSTSSSG